MRELNSFQRHNRQRQRRRLFGQAVIGLLLLGAAYYAYKLGENQMAARMGQRVDEVTALSKEREALRTQVVDLQAAALVDRQTISELEARYRAHIPDSQTEELITLLRARLSSGVSPDRLRVILEAAANPRSCRSRESKRFLLSTPLNQGTNNAATFAGGALVVSGEGKSTLNEQGRAEAWYDPSKPVKITFKLMGGRVSVAEGVLPLTHNVIDDTIEYRYTAEPGPRGFVSITGDICDYNITPPPPDAPGR